MATTDPFKAIMERLVEKTKQKAEAKGKSIYKPPPKPKKTTRCKRLKLN